MFNYIYCMDIYYIFRTPNMVRGAIEIVKAIQLNHMLTPNNLV